jgi:hypothetical protein
MKFSLIINNDIFLINKKKFINIYYIDGFIKY